MSSKPILLALSLLVSMTTVVTAGGPLIIQNPATRTAYSYTSTVNVYTDLGNCGPTLTNAEADNITASSFGEWTGVTSATFSHSNAGDFGSIGLPDITGLNAGLVVGPNNGGGIHVMYDNNGTIISSFFGAPPGVLGIASPEFAAGVSLTESWAVMNGTAVDPLDTIGSYFAGVFTHEFGHAINLAHSQTNGAIIFFGDARGPGGCGLPYAGSPSFSHLETMYPFIDPSFGSVGAAMSTVDRLDDIASISNINPAAGWPATFGEIQGTIYQFNGTTEVTGVNVIARNVSNPWADCISALSGDFTQGASGPDGLYRFRGLTSGASYVVYIDGIVAGGFSTPPSGVPLNMEEFYNGVNESADPATDIRCSSTSIAVSAGTTQTADVVINEPYLSLNDDGFAEVPLPFLFDICGTVYSSVFVNGNGSLTFGAGDDDYTPTVSEFLNGPPRIAAIWADLSPQEGIVTAQQVGPDYVVNWTNVPEFGTSNINTFTITLHPTSEVTVNYSRIDVTSGLAGVTVGNFAPNPGETDLSGAASPIVGSTVYENFTANDFDLDFSTLGFAPCSPQKEVTPLSFVVYNPTPGDTVCQTVRVRNNGDGSLILTSTTGCDTPPFYTDLTGLNTVLAPGDSTFFDICYSSLAPSSWDSCDFVIESSDTTCIVDARIGRTTSVPEGPGLPARLTLSPVTPNPIRGAAEIRFVLAEPSPVRLEVFDLAGRRVRSLLDEKASAGEQVVRWNSADDRGARVAAGIYLIRLRTPAASRVVRAVLMP